MNEENDPITFTVGRQEARLIGDLLKRASDEFGNHGCNDFELLEAFSGNLPAARHFAIGYHAHNLNKTRQTLCIGEKADAHFDPDMYDVFEKDLLNIPDYAMFSYIGAKFKRIAEIAPREETDD